MRVRGDESIGIDGAARLKVGKIALKDQRDLDLARRFRGAAVLEYSFIVDHD